MTTSGLCQQNRSFTLNNRLERMSFSIFGHIYWSIAGYCRNGKTQQSKMMSYRGAMDAWSSKAAVFACLSHTDIDDWTTVPFNKYEYPMRMTGPHGLRGLSRAIASIFTLCTCGLLRLCGPTAVQCRLNTRCLRAGWIATVHLNHPEIYGIAVQNTDLSSLMTGSFLAESRSVVSPLIAADIGLLHGRHGARSRRPWRKGQLKAIKTRSAKQRQ